MKGVDGGKQDEEDDDEDETEDEVEVEVEVGKQTQEEEEEEQEEEDGSATCSLPPLALLPLPDWSIPPRLFITVSTLALINISEPTRPY